MSSERLTARHLELLSAYAAGASPEETATAMGISRGRVWMIAMECRHTLGATTTTQAVALALSLGLIEVEHGQGSRLRRVRQLSQQIADLLEQPA